jgi:hypothetical protein
VGQHAQLIAHLQLGQGQILPLTVAPAMGQGRQARRQGLQGKGRTAYGIGLQRLAAGQHQHHQAGGQVLLQPHAGDNGHGGQQVGT